MPHSSINGGAHPCRLPECRRCPATTAERTSARHPPEGQPAHARCQNHYVAANRAAERCTSSLEGSHTESMRKPFWPREAAALQLHGRCIFNFGRRQKIARGARVTCHTQDDAAHLIGAQASGNTRRHAQRHPPAQTMACAEMLRQALAVAHYTFGPMHAAGMDEPLNQEEEKVAPAPSPAIRK